MNVNQQMLRGAVKGRREREGLTLEDVEGLTGVSKSTLCRFERGKDVQGADILSRLAMFGRMSLSEMNGKAAPAIASGNVLENIEELLKHDPSLRPEDAKGLMTIMRTAYRRAVEK